MMARVHRDITLILDRLLAIRRPVVGYWARIPAAWLDPLYEQKTGSVTRKDSVDLRH
jgi:hypothetical protein